MKRHSFWLLIIGISFLLGCQSTKSSLTNTDSHTKELYTLMTGSFSSSDQSKRDTNYYDITLHMYPIWKEREGNWLYVEQSVTRMQDRPYRQRVYHIVAEDGKWKSEVYTLPHEKTFIGKWKTPEAFASLTPDSLIIREGCAVYLERKDKMHFQGKTQPQTCTSTLRGAAYATSEVEIQKDLIVSWDQGFDSSGTQVWGATQRGYEFRRLVR